MSSGAKRVHLSPPHLGESELALVQDALASGWIAPVGPQIETFEKEFAQAVGVPHAVALSSGTAAIHLSLRLLGLERGDEVLCSTLTFSASANPIVYEGGRPFFIDSERSTWNMDPDLLREELRGRDRSGKRPRAVIVVDLYGQSADHDRIMEVCGEFGVPIIEDAAEALGATYKGESVGRFGRLGVFSFNGNKIITTSGGGMLVSEDAALIERARFLATQARDEAPHYQHSTVGFNYRMSNVLAAIGRGQLGYLPERVAARRRNFECYREGLGDLPGVEFMPEAPHGRATRWLTCLTFDPERFGATREDVRHALLAEHIEARPVWKPLHLQPVFAACGRRGGAIAEELFERGLCLPSGSNLGDNDRERVVHIIRSQYRGGGFAPAVVREPRAEVSPPPAPDPIYFKRHLRVAKTLTQPVRQMEQASVRGLPRWWQRMLNRRVQFGLDITFLVAAFLLSYLLRFDFRIPETHLLRAAVQLPLVVVIQFAALVGCGVHSFVWRYVGIAESGAFLRAALSSFLPLLLMRFGLPDALFWWRVPLSILMLSTVLGFVAVLSLRVVRRLVHEHVETGHAAARHGTRVPVLLVGAGEAGVLAAKEIRRRAIGLELKGFVDDDRSKKGLVIQGIRVLGETGDLPRLVDELGIDQVVITIAATSRRNIRRIVEICEKIPVRVKIIPGLYEILEGSVSVSSIRDVQIEDLLGRDQVRLDEREVWRFLSGKTVLVTGAGGSIGAELARQVASFCPRRLLLLERAEFTLFEIDRELRRLHPQLELVPMLADVGDRSRTRAILSEQRPDVILHAAAHKHVPLMESHPSEAVKNNVMATNWLGEMAGELGVGAFVLVSTDKAVRPTSIMGASKRVAELVVQDLARRFPTRYVVVRFGNVMGSAGSVVPIFREQIARGGPLTITHPEMTRFFMTVSEASQLVLQAGTMGNGGEIFILNMGEPVRIVDLARDMVLLSGLKPFEDIDIVFTGLRPGEKLSEELQLPGESVLETGHPKILVARISPYPETVVRSALRRLESYAEEERELDIRRLLSKLLPEARLTPAISRGSIVKSVVTVGAE